jgi:hypothetical protein
MYSRTLRLPRGRVLMLRAEALGGEKASARGEVRSHWCRAVLFAAWQMGWDLTTYDARMNEGTKSVFLCYTVRIFPRTVCCRQWTLITLE